MSAADHDADDDDAFISVATLDTWLRIYESHICQQRIKMPYRPEIFFRPYFHYCLSNVHYCEDHFHPLHS